MNTAESKNISQLKNYPDWLMPCGHLNSDMVYNYAAVPDSKKKIAITSTGKQHKLHRTKC